MVSLIVLLCPVAFGGEVVVHTAFSAGSEFLPSTSVASSGPVVRFELGAGPSAVQGYAVVLAALHNAQDAYTQMDTIGTAIFPGDFYLVRVGGGARVPFHVGRFEFTPHANAGLAVLASPADQDLYIQEFGSAPESGLKTASYWAQGGGDVGVYLDDDHMAGMTLGMDAGLVGIAGVGFTIDARLGFFARL